MDIFITGGAAAAHDMVHISHQAVFFVPQIVLMCVARVALGECVLDSVPGDESDLDIFCGFLRFAIG